MQIRIRNQYSKQLIILEKTCKDNNKFGGISNNFNFKVTIFLNKYRQIGLPKNA